MRVGKKRTFNRASSRFLRMPHAETSIQDRIEYRPSVLEPQAIGANRAGYFI